MDPRWRKSLLRADSRDVIRRIPDHSIDLILTDPPNNLAPHSTGNIPPARKLGHEQRRGGMGQKRNSSTSRAPSTTRGLNPRLSFIATPNWWTSTSILPSATTTSPERECARACASSAGNKEEIEQIPDGPLRTLPSILLKEMDTNLFRKMSRMKVLEQQKHLLPEADLRDNIETAIKSAVYMDLRALYNTPSLSPVLHCALFLFIRNYAYSGMFRYNDKGQFNVPYGGIAYNAKSMRKKLDYYRSIPLLAHFRSAHIYNMDFEQFLPAARRGG